MANVFVAFRSRLFAERSFFFLLCRIRKLNFVTLFAALGWWWTAPGATFRDCIDDGGAALTPFFLKAGSRSAPCAVGDEAEQYCTSTTTVSGAEYSVDFFGDCVPESPFVVDSAARLHDCPCAACACACACACAPPACTLLLSFADPPSSVSVAVNLAL